MPSLKELLPDPSEILELEPEEIAPALLTFLSSDGSGYLILHDLIFPDNINQHFDQQFETQLRDDLAEQLALAWNWLDREGLIVRKSGDNSGFHRLTRRGRQLAQSENIREEFRQAKSLPRNLLHPLIDAEVWPDFLRGRYDSAVMKAFRLVEIEVRGTGGFSEGDYGVPMIRDAFKEESGPLADHAAPPAEQQSLSHLFAGAYGSYRNATSHRHIPLKAQETAEMIVLASHLLKIVESRAT